MYRKLEPAPRMTTHEASERYPDSHILMQMDNIRDLSNEMGVALYVGDDGDELFSLQVHLPVPSGLVVEGLHHLHSLGGIVVGT